MINIPEGVVYYIDYMMLKHASIFPNPLRVLEHIFCVNGNGYNYYHDTIRVNDSKNSVAIDKYIEKHKKDYKQIRNNIATECFVNSLKTSLSFSISHFERYGDNSLSDHILTKCKKTLTEMKSIMDYPIIMEEDLTIDALRKQLVEYNASVYEKVNRFRQDYSLPYPISKGYAICYNMNENSPLWMVQLCYNISFVYLEYMKTIPEDFESPTQNIKNTIEAFEEVVSNCEHLLRCNG